MKSYGKLTYSLINQYSDRKKEGYLATIQDTITNEVYIVPKDIEHIDFIVKILSLESKQEIIQTPDLASHLVPSIIEINDDGIIIGVVTGVSGAEMGYGVRHTEEQLKEGHTMVLKFINGADMPKSDNFKDKIVYRFISETKRTRRAA